MDKKISPVSSLKNTLTDMQRYVTQQCGTEPAFSGVLLHNKGEGVYYCLICHAPLFLSEKKYDSGSGWPSFWQPYNEQAIRYLNDDAHGMQRVEIRCASCDAHLGHVFPDGAQDSRDRYCVNSVSLKFIAKSGAQIDG